MKLITKVVTIVCFLFFGLHFAQAQCDGTNDIIQNDANSALSTSSTGNVGMGNSFFATCSGTLDGVSFWTSGTSPGTIGGISVTVELYQNPFSSSRVLLASVTTDTPFQNSGALERYFAFDNSPALIGGAVYGVRMIVNDSNTFISIQNHTGNRLVLGNMFANNFSASGFGTRDLRFQIHYEDNVAPEARCRNITRALGPDGTVSITAGNINNNSTDADSGTGFLGISQSTFTCDDLGENTVTLFVRDQENNLGTCQAIVTITDGTDPVITCPSDITVFTDPGVPVAVDYTTMYDDCSFAAPDDFTFLGRWEDKYFYLSDNTIQIDQAFAEAESLGGHVATILDAAHNSFIRTAVDEALGTTNEQVLIGYNDVAIEDTFVWHDGNTTATYTNWGAVEPNNAGGNEDYTIINSGSVARWNDLSGTQVRRYILQLSPTLTQTSGFASGDFFPVGTTTNTFEATDAFGNSSSCSFDVTVIENPYETSVALANGKLTITDIETASDDQITLSNDGTTLTISNLILPTVSGGPTLLDSTTVTVQLANITNGIEFISGNGDNAITFADALTLSGANNGISLRGLSTYTQSGIITIDGDFTVTNSPTATFILKGLNAANLDVTDVFIVADSSTSNETINITGTTNLQANGGIIVRHGTSRHTFGGLVTLNSDSISFSAGADVTLGTVTIDDTDSSINLIDVRPGNLLLSDNIQVAGNSNIHLRSDIAISQVGGAITANELTIQGRNDGATIALIPNNNDVNTLKTVFNQSMSLITFQDIDDVAVGEFTVNELNLIAPNIIFTEDTRFNKIGTGSTNFNGDISITNGNANREATINHNEGTINFSGAITDFSGELDYNGVTGVITNFSGTTTLDTDGITPIFGTINTTSTLTVDVFTSVLNEARFTGNTAILKGRGSLIGAPIILENDATITPGSIGDVASLSLSDLTISSATFAPVIENDDDYDILEVQGTVTLNNATLAPITGTDAFGIIPITLIDNDGTDAVVGTFNGYPEGSSITFGNFIGTISYVGGDGNDVVLELTETTVELSTGKLTITDVNGGTSDDQITFASDGTTLTISNLTAPVQVIGGPTRSDATTITIPLASITNGIEFVSEAGSNAVTITNDLTLPGTANFLKLNNLGGYTQTGAINIGGDLELIGDGNVIFNLTEITAGSLTISNNAGITDTSDSIIISGATSVSSSERIIIDQGQGNHQFSGIVTIDAKDVFFTNSIDTTFGTISIAEPVDGEPNFINFLSAIPGSIDFSDTVSIPGTDSIDTNLFVYSIENITQSSGTMTVDFLILYGTGNTVATLESDNVIRAIAAENPIDTNNVGLASVTLKSTDAIALEKIFVNEFNLTSPTIRTFPDFTSIRKDGAGESFLNGNLFVQNGSLGTGSGVIEHNNGTITITGDTIDLTGRITYTGTSGTITNLNANTVRLPLNGDNANVTFGTLNANTNVDIGDDTITILNEANFSGSGTVVNGTATFSGGTTIISNTATITPGTSSVVATVTTSNFEITDGTYAPRVESDTSYDNISVVGSVTLSNATLSPTEGFVSDVSNAPIILITNDGIDPVIGTFNNLPENAGVSFGDYEGMITYSGGNGNDVSLVPDTIDPTAICQDLNLAIGLDGITINGTQIDNGSSDNAGIESFLINGQSQINFTYEDLGAHLVTLTVTDPSGNTAQCDATITLTSNVTFPILISEYQPKPVVSNPTQNIEIKGEPGEAFLGVFVVIENDADSGNVGLVLSADTISGTFNPDGLLTASIPDIADPSHTVVLTTSFSGTVGVTNVSTGGNVDRNTVDLSTFGIILDAVGVGDGGACCPVDSTLGAAFGGVDVPSIGAIPAAIFRSASTGDFYQIKQGGDIYNPNGAIVDDFLFDNAPTIDGTFGQINPTFSLNTNQSAFITTWKTDNIGASGDDQIRIFTDLNETYNYAVDWGDGTLDTGVTSDIVHTYSAPGTYTITIAGTFPKFESNSSFGGDALKLLSIDQWGDIAWTSFEDSFVECKNMDVLATDVPDLSNVTSLDSMFEECNALVGNATFNTWDVSTIQNMKGMFAFCHAFNQPLDNWNVSNVTDMSGMFSRATIFNQDLNSWNTSQVQSMNFMFNLTSDFNGQIDNWNVSNVTEMTYMFNEAEAFNRDISGWNTAQVTAMNGMFQNAPNFNQDISGWNVANVSNMSFMFKGATNFNQDLSNWDVSNVTTADEMLLGSTFSVANYDLLLVNWSQLTLQDNVNFDTDASYCIGETAKQNIITNHNWNFTDAGVNCDAFFITKWETTTANESITIPTIGSEYNYFVDWGDGTIETGITGNATHSYATAGQYEVKILGDFPRIHFNNNGDKLKILEVMQWGAISWSSMGSAFYGCINLHITATDAPDLSLADSTKSMLRQTAISEDISHWNVSTIEDMSYMLRNCTNFNADISSWNISNVRTFASFLYGATAFNRDLSSWDMSNATQIRSMFRNATAFNQDLSSWDISNITSASFIFSNTALSTENYDAILKGWATLDTAAGETAIPNDILFGATNTQYCEAEYERQILIDTYNWDITDSGKEAGCINPNSFITTWETTADNESITIPTTGTGYNYFVDWGDGTVASGFNGDATHTYATAGTYTVSILGDFPRVYFNFSGDRTKIQEVQQWGTIEWSSMERAFSGCANLNVTATDTPNLTNVTNTSRMFNACSSLLGNAIFNTWDVSTIQDMSYMFTSASSFNTDLNNWNTVNVTNLRNMFSTASAFNGNISTWNTGEVTDMTSMFFGATAFEGTGGLNSWNVTKVESMTSMFRNATTFSSDLNSWNVANVTTMNSMFWGATVFNGNISSWNITGLTSLDYMFYNAAAFNGDLSLWNVSNVESLDSTFYGASSFNSDLNTWNVSNVTDMFSLFDGASSFNKPLDTWDVSNVTEMYRMFYNATLFNQDLSNWDVSSSISMSEMFLNTAMSVANYDNLLNAWSTLTLQPNVPFGISSGYCDGADARQSIIDTYNWTITDEGVDPTCSTAFVTTWETTAANESITIPTFPGETYNYVINWGDGTSDTGVTGDATHTYTTAGIHTISIAGDFPRIYFNNTGDRLKIQEVQQWGSIAWTSMEFAFGSCNNLDVTATDTPDLSQVTNTFGMFAFCGNLVGNASFNSWDVSNVENMSGLFFGCFSFNQLLTNWNVSAVTSMVSTFSEADIYNQPLESWNVSNVTDMRFMFRGANKFNQPLANWNVSNVQTMEGMFRQATDFNQPLENWNISNVINMEALFADATNFDQPLNNWNMSNVEITTNMFLRAENFNQPLDNWNVSNVINMELMFGGAISFNQDLSNWDVSNVTTLQLMFFEATAFDQDLGSWDISSLTGLNTMFTNAGMSTENYDSTLIGWATLDTGETQIPTGITFNGGSSQYCLSETERQSLIDTYGWTIDDGGREANCNRFITTWETTTASETITIPTFSGETYNYIVNWGDGTVERNITGDATHTYANAGTYQVVISGSFPRIYFNNTGDKLKIQTVQEWGKNIWSSMESAFAGCENLEITATDVPDLSNTTSMTSMFEGAILMNTDISNWDVSNITTMNRMFYGATSFDQDLSPWDISNMVSMDDMFTNAMLSTANYDNTILGWRTLATGEAQIPTNITFSGGDSTFCQSDYEREELIHTYNWTITDAGKATDCTNRRFITTWKTDSNNERITIPTDGTGYNYLVDWGDGTVDIDITGDATHVYATAGVYTVSITGDFPRVYFNTTFTSQIQTIEQWGSNEWDTMFRAFSNCANLDVVATDIPDLSNVTQMGRMFFGCSSLVGNASFNNWDVSNVTNLGATFQGASSFNQPLNNWDVSNVIKFTGMFSGATSFDQSLADWDISSVLDTNVANALNMFAGVTLSTENYDATLIGWATLDSGETRIPTPVRFSGGNSQYCLSETKRQELIDLGWTITDGGRNCGEIILEAKAYLQGAALNPNVGEENLMRDDLRVAGMIPTRSPYADMISCELTVFDVTGDDAIVDWIWVELRDAADNTTVIDAQSALLQRDGDIVSVDGTSALAFAVTSENYYITIQHRNHLGIMSANTIALSTTATTVDFTDGSTPTFGTNAQTSFGMPSGVTAMWTGNVNNDPIIQYSGTDPDTPEILSEVLNDPGNFLNFPTYAVGGYKRFDINMDGNTQYSGTNPDTPIILQNVIAHPGNFLNFSTYQIIEQLPSN